MAYEEDSDEEVTREGLLEVVLPRYHQRLIKFLNE